MGIDWGLYTKPSIYWSFLSKASYSQIYNPCGGFFIWTPPTMYGQETQGQGWQEGVCWWEGIRHEVLPIAEPIWKIYKNYTAHFFSCITRTLIINNKLYQCSRQNNYSHNKEKSYGNLHTRTFTNCKERCTALVRIWAGRSSIVMPYFTKIR